MAGTLEDAGWRGGLNFQPRSLGRVKLAKTAPFYRGRWVEYLGARENGTIRIWIEPCERDLDPKHVEQIKLREEPHG